MSKKGKIRKESNKLTVTEKFKTSVIQLQASRHSQKKFETVAAQMYELVTRKIPQIVWAESGSYLLHINRQSCFSSPT